MASRRTLIIAGFILIFLGVFTKIGAVLSTIPIPLVGGVLASSMAMVFLNFLNKIYIFSKIQNFCLKIYY